MDPENGVFSLQDETFIQTTSDFAHDLSEVDDNEILSNENQDESFMTSELSSSTPSQTSSAVSTSVKRRKVAVVHDYIIEQPDGSTLCKICRVRFGNKTQRQQLLDILMQNITVLILQ
jgi:hypothetical protein